MSQASNSRTACRLPSIEEQAAADSDIDQLGAVNGSSRPPTHSVTEPELAPSFACVNLLVRMITCFVSDAFTITLYYHFSFL